MATEGCLEEGLQLDVTQLCPLQTVLEVLEILSVQEVEVKLPT